MNIVLIIFKNKDISYLDHVIDGIGTYIDIDAYASTSRDYPNCSFWSLWNYTAKLILYR